ncbi:MAG: CoB--CoM heterodisulfide reductase iron-sulfur subunit A family protein [Acidobacteria bacterium]|nr:CoB--CoM heterodisulfide reductase iron-sulfur subunit A family protein [Acidobacteriota bacterium]
MDEFKKRYDGLVIGGGIAGMQAALDLAEQDYEVLLIEKDPSIGGVMIGLNKVFPTLDCSSCICTPRMAESVHHKNIKIQAYSEVTSIRRHDPGFKVTVRKKPRYVIEDKCIGCSQCELECPVDVPHEFDHGLGARRAIYIPHGNAIPQVATLDVDHCTFCGRCAKVCPTQCVDYTQEAEDVEVDVGAVIVTTGLNITPMDAKKEYGGGHLINVMNPLAMEAIQASNGPFGRPLRPSDGKVPRTIAYVQCAGSRDHTIGIPYCSRVCCMYALKQALLLRHYLHDVEITLYHMDIRAFGKGYEQFYRRVMNEGVNIVKGKVAKITEVENQDLLLRVERLDEGGRLEERRYDLVVLSQGLVPAWQGKGVLDIELGDDGFFKSISPKISPVLTSAEGIFVAGVAAGPKDIPDAIVEAGAAAMEAAIHLEGIGYREQVLTASQS